MKKLFFLAFLAVSLVACKKSSSTESTTETPASTEQTNTAGQTATSTSDNAAEMMSNVPQFDNADVQKYVDKYQTFITKYTIAVKEKSPTDLNNVSQTIQELTTEGQAIMGKLKGDDLQKFTKFMAEKSTELMELSKMPVK